MSDSQSQFEYETEPFQETNPTSFLSLLTDPFKNNTNLWTDLFTALGDLINPNIQSAADELINIRNPYVAPQYAALNTRMLGFNVTNTSFSQSEYVVLMAHLGEFWQTRGASEQFLNFLCFVKNIYVQYVPLWANLQGYTIYQLNEIPVSSLTASHGLPVWEGGTWFPTTYYDAIYDPNEVPFATAQDLLQFLYQLQPAHLVLRNLGGIVSVTAYLYEAAIPLPTNLYAPSVTTSNVA